MSEPEDKKPEKADVVVGVFVLIGGWFMLFLVLDAVFVKKYSYVSQPFFIIEPIAAAVLLISGTILVCRYYFRSWEGWD